MYSKIAFKNVKKSFKDYTMHTANIKVKIILYISLL